MSRSLALLFCGVALAGCSAGGDLMRTAVPTVPLQFESEPPGAEVRTSGGQTCKTPCALAVPAADMQVTYNLNGYQPQTVPVKLMQPDDMRDIGEFGGSAAPPRFTPSPVTAELVKVRRAPAPKKSPARVAKRPAPQPSAADVEPGDGRPRRRPVGSTPRRRNSRCRRNSRRHRIIAASPRRRAERLHRQRRPGLRPTRLVDPASERPPLRWGLLRLPLDTPRPRHLCPGSRARSSAGEHSLHTGGVTGSIPVAPTISRTPTPDHRRRYQGVS
jgi:hypothetical protein